MPGVRRRGSGGEVGDVDEPVGDPFEDSELVVAALDPAVGGSIGVVEGEDLISTFEEGPHQRLVFEEGMVLIDLDEGAESLVGLVAVSGEVDAVQVLEHPPCCFEFGPAPAALCPAIRSDGRGAGRGG